jgi:hypothetical protein
MHQATEFVGLENAHQLVGNRLLEERLGWFLATRVLVPSCTYMDGPIRGLEQVRFPCAVFTNDQVESIRKLEVCIWENGQHLQVELVEHGATRFVKTVLSVIPDAWSFEGRPRRDEFVGGGTWIGPSRKGQRA